MSVKTFLLFPEEDDEILALDNPQVVTDIIQIVVKLRQIIRQRYGYMVRKESEEVYPCTNF
jgi:hypothetical protein